MLSCAICKISKNTYFEEHLRTTASKHRSSFLEVSCKSCCAALINAVMKYSFSTAVVQGWRALHANLLIIPLHHRYFSKNSPQVQNSNMEICILMAASEDKFLLETFLHGCFSKTAANIFILEFPTHTLHFLLWRLLKRKEFLWFFLSKGFGEKV